MNGMLINKQTFHLNFNIGIIADCLLFLILQKGVVDCRQCKSVKARVRKMLKKFSTDSGAAKMKYTGKILAVSGEIAQVSKNQQNHEIVLLKTATAGASVNCTMEETGAKINIGDKVVIKGICSGIGQGDADLGILGDVYLLSCYVSK